MTSKTVHLDEDVHTAARVLAALEDASIKDIVNGAVREQYDTEELNRMAQTLLEESEQEQTAES